MKILLSGGGTLGPVTPLLALVEYWRAGGASVDLVWVGTTKGPEVHLISALGVRYISVASVKFPRYATLYWLAVPFLAVYAMVEAWNVLRHERPDVIVTAGGYVSVPLVVLGRLMGVKSWVHQQDLLPGLANRVMAWFASRISVTFESSRAGFPARKTEVLGNAVRASVLGGDREKALRTFGLDADRKTLLVLGGGSGSAWVNRSVSAIADLLVERWQVLHVAGRDKAESVVAAGHHYVVEPMLGDAMADAYAAADVVLCRAGLGTLTELAAVGKPAIVIPFPGTHQEDNAFFLYEHQCALILDQTETTPQVLFSAIRSVMDDEDVQMRLAANMQLSFPKDGTAQIADGVLALAREATRDWQRAEPLEMDAVEDDVALRVERVVEESAVLTEDEEEAIESIEMQLKRALGGDDAISNDEPPFRAKNL